MRALPLATALLLASTLTACTGHADDDAPDPGPDWQEASLPVPPGAPGRLAVREATRCGDAWYVVGGVLLDQPTSDQDSRPAAWRSEDGREWTALPIRAATFWGQRAVLASVACASGTIAAVGARPGGAHGNPRVTTFYADGAGLHDVEAPSTQYGGEAATNVGPISGGAKGWLIAGNRISGPAVWTSPTGRRFTLHEDVPGLADDGELSAFAQDAAWDGEQWVLVGGGNAPGKSLDRQPQAWLSADGSRWSREAVPGSIQLDDLERVTEVPGGVLALGLHGRSFGAWRREDGAWGESVTFGHLPSEATRSPFVASLSGSDDGLWATTSDGVGYALWHSTDGDDWRPVGTPRKPPTTAGEHVLSVAADDAGVVLLADDGRSGRVWTAR